MLICNILFFFISILDFYCNFPIYIKFKPSEVIKIPIYTYPDYNSLINKNSFFNVDFINGYAPVYTS